MERRAASCRIQDARWVFPGMPSSARTALSETVFGETQARSSLAQGKDALKNLKDCRYGSLPGSLAVQFGPSQTAFKVVWPHLGLV